MLAFPVMLVEAAERAGIKIPDDIDNFDINLYPHWHVFCAAQLGQPMPTPGCHWENAEVIAAIPEDRIRAVTLLELREKGFQSGFPIP